MKLIQWPLMGALSGLLQLVQQGGEWAGPQPAQTPPRCTKCNSPPNAPINGQCTKCRIAVNGPLLCGFKLGIKGLIVCCDVYNCEDGCQG